MKTLNDIAGEYGVSLQTVYNWRTAAESKLGRKIQGIPHPNDRRKVLYSPDAIALITVGRQPEQSQPVDVTVEVGNHCASLDKPDIGGTTFSLECFRADDVTALTFEDPEAVADEFLSVADLLIQGMDADIKAREEQLKKTRAAQGKVSAKAQDLKLEKRLYRDRARDLDTAQTTETDALKDAISALQALGKPQAPQDGSTA